MRSGTISVVRSNGVVLLHALFLSWNIVVTFSRRNILGSVFIHFYDLNRIFINFIENFNTVKNHIY